MHSKPKVRNRVVIPIDLTSRKGNITPVTREQPTFKDCTFVTFSGLVDSKEHFAIVFKSPIPNQNPFVRLHSECITGDLFGSCRCDCGNQLQEALKILHEHGGILLYLRQEGRGIGLYNKIDAYSFQDLGLDTYQANVALGFAEDLRNYRVAAQMLSALEVKHIRLITNNPKKSAALSAHQICVEEVIGTGTYVTPQNLAYLSAKQSKENHTLSLYKNQVQTIKEVKV